jgi:hypothetical protein
MNQFLIRLIREILVIRLEQLEVDARATTSCDGHHNNLVSHPQIAEGAPVDGSPLCAICGSNDRRYRESSLGNISARIAA